MRVLGLEPRTNGLKVTGRPSKTLGLRGDCHETRTKPEFAIDPIPGETIRAAAPQTTDGQLCRIADSKLLMLVKRWPKLDATTKAMISQLASIKTKPAKRRKRSQAETMPRKAK